MQDIFIYLFSYYFVRIKHFSFFLFFCTLSRLSLGTSAGAAVADFLGKQWKRHRWIWPISASLPIPIYLSFYPSIYPSNCLSIYLLVGLSISLSTSLYIVLSTYPYLSTALSIYLHIYLYISTYFYLTTLVYLYPSIISLYLGPKCWFDVGS